MLNSTQTLRTMIVLIAESSFTNFDSLSHKDKNQLIQAYHREKGRLYTIEQLDDYITEELDYHNRSGVPFVPKELRTNDDTFERFLWNCEN